MRVLLDECIPARLGRELVGHVVNTTPQMGWGGLKNGVLLTQAVAVGFEVFITVDKNLPKQQNLAVHPIAVLVLRCATNDINDLKRLVPGLLLKLPTVKKGEAIYFG